MTPTIPALTQMSEISEIDLEQIDRFYLNDGIGKISFLVDFYRRHRSAAQVGTDMREAARRWLECVDLEHSDVWDSLTEFATSIRLAALEKAAREVQSNGGDNAQIHAAAIRALAK